MEKVIAARMFALRATDLDPLSYVNTLIYPATVRDRFGCLNKYSPINWTDSTDPIPEAFSEPVALGTIMDARIKELLERFPEGNIVVCWSGGVDSTALLCACLQSGMDINRLVVVGSEDSIEEYPFFYELLKGKGVNIRLVSDVTAELEDIDCAVILTGWCADQLFGSDVNLNDVTLYNEPWLEALAKYVKGQTGKTLSDKSKVILKEVYEGYAQYLGLKIEQWCEFLWLLNFGCKWTYVQNETNLSLVGTKNYGKAVAFYEALDFQRWSVTRFPTLRERNPHTNALVYKKPLKQYILNYTADRNYYRTKGKMATRRLPVDEFDTVAVLTESGPKKYKSSDVRSCNVCLHRAVADLFRKKDR